MTKSIDINSYVYRCKICRWECRKKQIPGSNVPVTKLGDYGSKGTPTGEAFYDELYKAATISFTAAAGSTPAYLSDSCNRLGEKQFKSEMPIRVETSSGTNDGEYTIAARGVSRDKILLSSSDSLTTETATTAGTVTISTKKYKPNYTRGCPGCGSLNSKGD
jgi:hypothetical protein